MWKYRRTRDDLNPAGAPLTGLEGSESWPYLPPTSTDSWSIGRMMGFAAFIVILVAGILVLVRGLQWIGHRPEPLPPADTGRLDRLETALTALEGRVDELHDQQQFLERLLSDRPDPRALESGPNASPGGADSVLFDRDEADEGGTR